jgi:hypothetical protein
MLSFTICSYSFVNSCSCDASAASVVDELDELLNDALFSFSILFSYDNKKEKTL